MGQAWRGEGAGYWAQRSQRCWPDLMSAMVWDSTRRMASSPWKRLYQLTPAPISTAETSAGSMPLSWQRMIAARMTRLASSKSTVSVSVSSHAAEAFNVVISLTFSCCGNGAAQTKAYDDFAAAG